MDVLLTAMSRALADVDGQLRKEFPDLFVKVDAILNDPARGTPNYENTEFGRLIESECGWCGDPFWQEPSLNQPTCSRPCGQHYSLWRKRRAS